MKNAIPQQDNTNTKQIFKKNESAAFTAAYRHGWNKDYTWLKDKTHKWTKENCIKEGKKYSSKQKFRENSICAYLAAKRMNLLDKIFNQIVNYVEF